MTILEVTAVPFGPHHRGGGESYPWRLARELSRWEKVVSCFSYESESPDPGVPSHRIPARFLHAPPAFSPHNPLPTLATFRSIVDQLGARGDPPEFVHVHNLRTAMSATWLLLARLRRAQAGYKVLLTDHGARWFPFPRMTAAVADYYVPVSEASLERLVRWAQRPSFVLPPGIPTDYPGLARELRSYDAREFDLVFFGRVVPWKRPDLALRLARELAPQLGRTPRLAIAGSIQDPGFLKWLKTESVRLGLSDTVSFLPDPSDEAAVDLLGRSKLHLFLSARTDVFGRRYPAPELASATLLEAAACGTPTVCSDLPGAREQLRPDRTGIVVSLEAWDATVASVARLLADAERWKGMSAGAREFVRTERTYRVLAERFSGFLREVREGRR